MWTTILGTIGAVVGAGLIVWIIVFLEVEETDHGIYASLAVLLAFGLFYLTICQAIITYDAGVPLNRLNDDDMYKIVYLAPVADSPSKVAVGMRKLADGRSYATRNSDMVLRAYCFARDPFEKFLNRPLPIIIIVKKIGDTVSIIEVLKTKIGFGKSNGKVIELFRSKKDKDVKIEIEPKIISIDQSEIKTHQPSKGKD
jgi:hypothetical protein